MVARDKGSEQLHKQWFASTAHGNVMDPDVYRLLQYVYDDAKVGT